MSDQPPEILFVHGLWMHGRVFALHRRRLRERGRGSHAYSYPSLRGSLEGAADGMVTVAETRWPGARGHIVMPLMHLQMLWSSACLMQAVRFVDTGAFDHGPGVT